MFLYSTLLAASFIAIAYSISSYEVSLFGKGKLRAYLQWSIDSKTKSIGLNIHMPTAYFGCFTGLVFSNYGALDNADVLIIRRKNNEINLQDMWTDKWGYLHTDAQQDYTLLFYNRTESYFTIGVSRAINTCHQHDYVFDRGTTNIISLYTEKYFKCSDKFEVTDVTQLNRSHVRVQLLKPGLPVKNMGKTSSHFDILSKNITIPKLRTSYICSVHYLPKFNKKVHGVGFEGIISNHGLVHHIEVFVCDVNDDVPPYSGFCDSDSQPKQLERCRHVIAAWAFGATAGLALGVKSISRFVRLEVHYNNPEGVENQRDTSGIRFYYSEILRKHDVGIMEVGTIYTPNMAIPPGQSNFRWPGVCSSACTAAALNSNGIFIFGSELHAHLTGRKIQTSLYRQGKFLMDINRDEHYSTWFEEIRHIYPVVHVRPGDALVTTCSFDTTLRQNVTLGGLGLHEEMCVNYLYYYPATNLEVCKSAVSLSALQAFMTLENIQQGKLVNGFSHTGEYSYHQMNWTPSVSSHLDLLYRHAPMNVHCLQRNGASWPGNFARVTETYSRRKKKSNSCVNEVF